MPFELTVHVQPAPGEPAPPVELSTVALGVPHRFGLAPTAEGLRGRLELPEAPRYLRLTAHCGEGDGARSCLDELVLLDSVHAAELSYGLVSRDGQHRLVRSESAAPALITSFGWGLLLLAGLAAWWWRGGSHAPR